MNSKRQHTVDPRLVQALAHPLRVEILEVLSERVASPIDLSAEIGADLTHVAYHTRTLNQWGALALVDTAQKRGATEHFYRARTGTTLTWLRLDLDERGWDEVTTIMSEAAERVRAVSAASKRRLGRQGRARRAISAVAGLLNFEASG